MFNLLSSHRPQPWSISALGLIDIWFLSKPAKNNSKSNFVSLSKVNKSYRGGTPELRQFALPFSPRGLALGRFQSQVSGSPCCQQINKIHQHSQHHQVFYLCSEWGLKNTLNIWGLAPICSSFTVSYFSTSLLIQINGGKPRSIFNHPTWWCCTHGQPQLIDQIEQPVVGCLPKTPLFVV